MRADAALIWQQEVLVNRQRKRKRRPERAPEANAPLPYRGSSGALRSLQEAALGPDMDEPLPARRRRRKPRALLDDEDDVEEDNGEEPSADPHSRTGPMSVPCPPSGLGCHSHSCSLLCGSRQCVG